MSVVLEVTHDYFRLYDGEERCMQGFGGGPLRRPRYRWKDNIKTDLREVGWGVRYWIDLAQDRDRWRALQNAVMNLWVPYNGVNLLISSQDLLASQS
jgi:hypothetical protein